MVPLIEQANEAYKTKIVKALREIGAVSGRKLNVLPRIENLCPEFMVEEKFIEEKVIFLSNGCHLFCDKGSMDRDEFFIHKFISESVSNYLLNLTCFYHMSLKTLKVGDLIEIGSVQGLDDYFSHVLIYYPSLFPDKINLIESKGLFFNLSWVFPTCREEFNFININGLEKFKILLINSEYDLFDIRRDMGYLNQV